ncbi:MAG TPA: response regulator [Rhodopila sp.]|jgi:DNA-binding response OmpR family regulator|nr:response regulator [Rhodopila sp.]
MAETEHILVVEDDPLVSEIIVAALDDTYATTVVETAGAAMDRLRLGGIRLMLLDCTLPGGIGDDLLPEADQRGSAVILMSGDPGRAQRLSDPPRPFLLKPFSLGSLMSMVEKVLTETPPA